MSKKVLVISSTPRNGGNSDVICDRFVEGAKAAGHEVEKVRLKELTINFCTGCGICNQTHKCVHHDDMAELLDKLVSADVIALATPVYFFSMCAQLKVMIDRICPRYTEIANKKLYLIATAAESGKRTFEGTIAGFQGLLDCLPNPVVGGMLLGYGVWQVGEVASHPIINEAHNAGLNV